MNRWLISIAALLAPTVAYAQLPQPRLQSLFPLGGRVGTRTEVTLQGEHLEGAEKLLFSHPGITAAPVTKPVDRFYPEPRPVADRFAVTIAADVPPGVYDVRAAGPLGVSNARRFAVSGQPELVESEPNNDADHAQAIPLDAVVNGRFDERAYDWYRFTAAAGQRVIVHCVASRLDSKARGAMTVLDAASRELARTETTPTGDTIVDFTAPSGGPYLLRVSDFLYGGGERYGYRLIVWTGAWVDYIDPPMAQGGATQEFTVYGRNLPNAQAAGDAGLDGHAIQKTKVTTAAPVLGASSPVETLRRSADAEAAESPLRVLNANGFYPMGLTDGAPIFEREPNNDPEHAQRVYPPLELVGRFNPTGDADWFTFEATKGQQLVIDLFSQRLGAATDPFFVVQEVKKDAKGKADAQDLKEVDDYASWAADKNSVLYRYPTNHGDPAMLFTAPETGVYRLMVRNLYFSSRGDPRDVYRLVVRPPQAAFELVAFPYQSTLVQPKKDTDLVAAVTELYRGGVTPVFVQILRQPGFDGEVTLTAERLPAGVAADPVVVPPWRSHGVLTLRAAADAPGGAGPIGILGRAKGSEVTRHARAAETLWEASGGRAVETQIVADPFVAVVDDTPAELAVDVGPGQTHTVARGGKLQIPVKLIKVGDFKGDLNLTAIDTPPTVKAGNVVLNAGQTSGTLSVEVDAGAPVGSFSFYLHGLVTVSHRTGVKAAERAQKDKERIAKVVADARQALTTATAAKAAAEQAAKVAIAEKAQAAQVSLQQTVEAEKLAQATLKEAEEAGKQAEAEASRLAAAASPRDIPVPITSPVITLEIKAP